MSISTWICRSHNLGFYLLFNKKLGKLPVRYTGNYKLKQYHGTAKKRERNMFLLYFSYVLVDVLIYMHHKTLSSTITLIAQKVARCDSFGD
jgi:hypothetical protein